MHGEIGLRMKRSSVIAGLLFGIVLGTIQAFYLTLEYQSLVDGTSGGLVVAVISGALFGGALYVFANSSTIKSQSAVDAHELFDGESIVLSSPSNLIVRP